MTDPKTYYSPEMVETLKKQTFMSEETWPKVMNPFCGQCLIERAYASGLVRRPDEDHDS